MNSLILNLSRSAEIILVVVYTVILVYTVIRILLDTRSTPKTLAYILLVLFVPVVGILFFFAFGGDYRHNEFTSIRYKESLKLAKQINQHYQDQTGKLMNDNNDRLKQYSKLVKFIDRHSHENLNGNTYKLLQNGEEKFPDVLKELEKAENHIHLEYYAWENDIRGNQIKDVLLKKAEEGVKVRVIYDAYASKGIVKNIVRELKTAGAEVHAIIKIKFEKLTQRMNHRDHRKIIIIDGKTGYIGGINISDRYDNSIDTGLYWRDTSMRIDGPSVMNLQRHFIVNWNFIGETKKLNFNTELFPGFSGGNAYLKKELCQIVAGGPVDNISNIMLTYFKIFTSVTDKLYIANPYFVPTSSILDALKQAAISGVDVRLLIPETSDSVIVGATTKFYFKELLEVGVKIYLYKKGFLHAKTLIADSFLSVVGTANMDIRSFDLNFEIMALIYGENFAAQLEQDFLDDLKESVALNYKDWINQPKVNFVLYSIARLSSSFL